jgi:4-hydroxybenzoate polyprenyltransferase
LRLFRGADDRALPDAVRDHWADRLTPPAIRPYLRLARLERPIGWWLLLLPCWWSAGLAAIARGAAFPDPSHLLLFMIGAIAMRGAGSTYNDLVDRDLDRRVERTRDRPLPSGRVGPAQAFSFLILQCLVGLAVLIQFNGFAIATGCTSVLIVLVYPFMKRLIPVPQLVLGLAFAWGGLMGWAAAFGSLDGPAVALYLGAVAWVIGYDTIYAIQDIEDDVLAGIKSSARFFGERVRLGVALCYAGTVLLVGLSFTLAGAGVLAFLGLLAFAAHLVWQVSRLSPRDGAGALRLFRANRDAGLMLFAGVCFDAAAQAF